MACVEVGAMTSIVIQLVRNGALSPGAGAEIRAVRGERLQHHWWELKRHVLKRDNHSCQICGCRGTARTLQIHHDVPVQWGGSNDPANLITLCPECHERLHSEHRVFRGTRTFDEEEWI